MKLIEELRLIQRIDQLIRLKATGSPKDLARRLDVSERTAYRIIQALKEMGIPIKYCKSKQSYMYEKKVKIRFECIIDDEKEIQITGGKKYQTAKSWHRDRLLLYRQRAC